MQVGGRVAIVTGGGAGIGRAVALRLGSEGAAVVVVDLDERAGRETVELLHGPGAFVRADVASRAEIDAMIAHAESAFGGLDVLVNNAGGVDPPYFPDARLGRWERVIDVNFRAVMAATERVIRVMRRRGGGAIVNIASVAGLGFRPHDAPEYAAAKAAVIRLTAALAPLRETTGIRVNCLCPDYVDTPAVRRSLARLSEAELPEVPRLVPPEEIAEAAMWLIGDDALAGRILVRWADEEGARLLRNDRRE